MSTIYMTVDDDGRLQPLIEPPTLLEEEMAEYHEHHEHDLSTWELIDLSVKHATRTLLYGPPGTGKTHVAKTASLPESGKALSITLHEDSTVAEMEGFYTPKGDRFEWKDGHAVTAWRYGYRLVLNEIDKAQGEVLTFLYGIMDDPELAEMTIGSGETLKPHRDFNVVATMNGSPNHLPEALVDRFEAIIKVGEVNPRVYDTMPADLARLARNPKAHKELFGDAPSTRPLLSYSRLRGRMGPEAAAQVVFGKKSTDVIDALKVIDS